MRRTQSVSIFCKPAFNKYRWIIVIATLLLAISAGASAADSVSALGRLEPMHGVRLVSAPLTPESISGAVVSQVMVKPGQDVEQGQLLAEMETAPLSRAHLAEAEAELELARRQEAARRAAASEVCVQADVAKRESERRKELLQKGVAGEEEADMAAGRAEALAAGCVSSRAVAHAAAAEIAVAEAHIELRKVQLQRSLVHAPVAGRVLAIHSWPGEMAALEGLLELAEVSQMYAIAEVYETDIGRIKVGQSATVSSPALGSVLTGTVETIHPKVAKMDTIGNDPAARKDARIIEVDIRLEDSAPASSLTYLQVDIVISTE